MLGRVVTAVGLALALATRSVQANTDADDTIAIAPAQLQAYATLMVDGVSYGDVVVVVAGTDVMLARSDALRAHVPIAGAKTAEVGGLAYVSLASLAPATTFRFDETTFVLSIVVNPSSLGTTTYGTSPRDAPAASAARPASAFLNYDITTGTGGSTSGYFESALSAHDSLLFSSEALQTGGPAQRGQTYYAHDDVAHLRREVVGDVSGTGGDALLGAVDVLGVGIQRQFAIDPYLVRFPQPSVAGVLSEPGTADVYVNGLLQSSVPLAPGGFDLADIPVSTGNSNVAVVIRDADGNVRTYNQAYFGTEALLRKGLTDYSYGAGLLRTTNQNYDDPALTAYYRIGATDALTLGGQALATARLADLEGDFDVKVGRAVVEGAEAVSDARGAGGMATNLGIAYVGANNGLSLSSTFRGSTYVTPDANAIPVQPPRIEIDASASQTLARGANVTASYFRQTFATLAPESTLVATVTKALHAGQLALSFVRSRSGTMKQTTSLGLSLTTQVGRRGSLTASQSLGNDAQNALDYTFAPPSNDIGFGYAFNHTSGPAGATLAMAQDRTPVGDVRTYLDVDAAGGATATLSVSGSAVLVDGTVMPAQPVTGAFTLVESGGVPSVPVTVDGRPVGKTDGQGRLVVSSIGPYADNRIELDDDATPLGVEIAHDVRVVSPGNFGGSVASFAVKRIAYFVGTVVLGSQKIVPANGVLELVRGSTSVRAMLDDTGAYYFENLTPGRYRATVRFGAAPCSFDFDVPAATGVANDLGERTCAP